MTWPLPSWAPEMTQDDYTLHPLPLGSLDAEPEPTYAKATEHARPRRAKRPWHRLDRLTVLPILAALLVLSGLSAAALVA